MTERNRQSREKERNEDEAERKKERWFELFIESHPSESRNNLHLLPEESQQLLLNDFTDTNFSMFFGLRHNAPLSAIMRELRGETNPFMIDTPPPFQAEASALIQISTTLAYQVSNFSFNSPSTTSIM